MKTLKSNISEPYKIQVAVWKIQSHPYDKNDMKEKVNDLVRLHEAMQGKLKTASIQNRSKFLPWYLNVLFGIF